jgi:hypothetical protein
LPRTNLLKIGIATSAAAVGAALAITSVFAHSTPSTAGHSVVGSIVKAAHAATFPAFANDPVPNAVTAAAELKAEAAEVAAELAAEQAAAAAKAAAEAAEAADTDDVDENVEEEVDDQPAAATAAAAATKVEKSKTGDHESD